MGTTMNWLQARAHARSQRNEMLERLDALAKVVELAKQRAADLHYQLLMAPAREGIKIAQIPQLEKIDVAFAAVEGLSVNSAPSAKSVGALIDAKTAIAHCVSTLPAASNGFFIRSGKFMAQHQDDA